MFIAEDRQQRQRTVVSVLYNVLNDDASVTSALHSLKFLFCRLYGEKGQSACMVKQIQGDGRDNFQSEPSGG